MAEEKKFVEEFMKVTNSYRERHQVDKLILNSEISKISQAWADKLTKMKNISHNKNPTYKGEPLGENIASRYSSEQTYYSGHRAVGQWYQEIQLYDFKKPDKTALAAGHFTQLVWKGSREVGVGKSQDARGMWIVVANYYPAGNIIGRYDTNVLPSIDGKTSLLNSPEDIVPVKHGGYETVKQDSIRVRKAMIPHSEKIETTIRFTKIGNEYKVEETVTSTKIDGEGRSIVSSRTTIRSPTKEELKKIKM